MAMMDCKTVLANLSDYVDGDVSKEIAEGIGRTYCPLPPLPRCPRHDAQDLENRARC